MFVGVGDDERSYVKSTFGIWYVGSAEVEVECAERI